MFALLHEVQANDLPPALKIRLCIPLENNDWVNQVVAAIEKKPSGYVPKDLDSWILNEHKTDDGFVLEIRPRFNRISPFAVAVDFHEKESGNVTKCSPGPAGRVPTGHVAHNWINSGKTLTDGTHAWVWGADNEANSTSSYYLFYKNRPSRIWLGHQQKLKLVNFQDEDR